MQDRARWSGIHSSTSRQLPPGRPIAESSCWHVLPQLWAATLPLMTLPLIVCYCPSLLFVVQPTAAGAVRTSVLCFHARCLERGHSQCYPSPHSASAVSLKTCGSKSFRSCVMPCPSAITALLISLLIPSKPLAVVGTRIASSAFARIFTPPFLLFALPAHRCLLFTLPARRCLLFALPARRFLLFALPAGGQFGRCTVQGTICSLWERSVPRRPIVDIA